MPESPIDKEAILTADFLHSIGHGPGVYLMKNNRSEVHYVGKARDLRRRLASYQRHLGGGQNKTSVMLSKTVLIETILTATEKEALILEASLIKQYKPKYNIILRDDKNYPYIMVTIKEEWPRLVVTRRRVKDQAIFGPFSSPSAMWETIKHLNTLFPLRRCKGTTLPPRARPCLNHQMNRCLAPCHGKVSAVEYRQMVEDLLLALAGKNKELLKRLNLEMLQAADDLNFEQAAQLRDKIKALNQTMEKQVIAAGHHRDQDVFGFARHDTGCAVAVLVIRNGLLSGHHQYLFSEPFEDDSLVMTEVLERFYDADRYVPNEVVVGLEIESPEVLGEWLSDLGQKRVLVRRPQRGDMVNLLTMANRNAEQVIVEHLAKNESWTTLAATLKSTLHLHHEPRRMICLDISHLSGEQTVGAVVSFWQGKKESPRYRHYKISSVTGPDDYASMTELLKRHLARAQAEDFMPNLLIVDGGKGQLQIAVHVIEDLGLTGQLDLLGIAKEKEEEGEKVFIPGRKNPLSLNRHSQSLLLLMEIRDEAHRFGITFHRNWRGKEALRSKLDAIPGVGPVRKQALLTAFGSLKRLSSATPEELSAIPGISPDLALCIHNVLCGS
ncbi:MAG: excinuclease ABC subunit UvrC [Desulfobulbaceae bacterium]|nr:excinuclease ABC subunit UvrC [Desulfobulbaceae bacterium]